MVNKTEIWKTFKKYFYPMGGFAQVTDSGLVNVQGDVDDQAAFPDGVIPVPFGIIRGDFNILQQPYLKALTNSPNTVHGSFVVVSSTLTHLTGAPTWVDGIFAVRSPQLRSLEHLPDHMNALRLNISPHLPLLRLTQLNMKPYQLRWGYWKQYGGEDNLQLVAATEIINAHLGTGKAGAIKAAAQLIRAGCKDNARW